MARCPSATRSPSSIVEFIGELVLYELVYACSLLRWRLVSDDRENASDI